MYAYLLILGFLNSSDFFLQIVCKVLSLRKTASESSIQLNCNSPDVILQMIGLA